MKLFTDDPIQSLEDDKLQRGAFADQVAEVCRRVHEQGESSVIALISPWGSGKSSVLNLIRASLAKDDSWLIGEYNPWLLSDIEGLVREFFSELMNLLPPKFQEGKLRKALRSYSGAVSPIASSLSLVGLNIPDSVSKEIESLMKGDTSLSKRKTELEKALRDLNKPILIILDDLDRLEPDELMMVFKLVRLVGRLPNVYYLLSYDEETLLDVIAQTDLARGNPKRGQDYLEKIVQLRIDLPPLHSKQQLKLLNAAFDDVAERNKVNISDDDQDLLNEAYTEVLSYSLDQPRAINRYFAQIDALYPLVDGEVNFTDFSFVTFLRTEFPKVHKLIQKRKRELVNDLSFGESFSGRGEEEPQKRRERWLKLLEEADCTEIEARRILDLLGIMFLPIKSAVKGGGGYGGQFYEDLRTQKRVGSPDYFDRYFQFGVPEGDISDGELRSYLKKLNSRVNKTQEVAVKWFLTKLMDDPALLLRKLGADIKESNYPHAALLELLGGGYNSMPEKSGTLGFDPQWDVIRLARRLFVQLTAEERKTVAANMVKTDSSLGLLSDLVDTAISDKKLIEKDIAADNKKILIVKDIIAKALKEHFDDLAKKKLDEAEDSDRTLLYRLIRMTGEDMPTFTWNFLEKSKWSLIDFVAWLVPTSRIWGDGKTKRGLGELSTTTLDEMFGLDKLIQELETELAKPAKPFDNRGEPTLENKRNYALSFLRGVRDSRQNQDTSTNSTQ